MCLNILGAVASLFPKASGQSNYSLDISMLLFLCSNEPILFTYVISEMPHIKGDVGCQSIDPKTGGLVATP